MSHQLGTDERYEIAHKVTMSLIDEASRLACDAQVMLASLMYAAASAVGSYIAHLSEQNREECGKRLTEEFGNLVDEAATRAGRLRN